MLIDPAMHGHKRLQADISANVLRAYNDILVSMDFQTAIADLRKAPFTVLVEVSCHHLHPKVHAPRS